MSETRPERSEPFEDDFADRRILVLIASYRDRELGRTVANALVQAAYPEHVRFAICHQYDEATRTLLEPWTDDPRFSIDEVPHTVSRGCCWARARTFDLHDDEPYILQIDAHTRFAARWDVRYIQMLEAIDVVNPVLTCYPPAYTVDEHGIDHYILDAGAQRLVLERLRHDLTTRQRTAIADDTSAPGPQPFLAAGQIFARGSFCSDIPYDPQIYFAGEEISLAVRAFTSGYDLFYPNENLIWHRYDHGERLHWEDNPDEHPEQHAAAVRRLRTLLSDRGTELGRYGLGTMRTLAEYEALAGVDFSQPGSGAGWSVSGRLALDPPPIDPAQIDQRWVFAVFSEDERELWRNDITDADVLGGNRRSIDLQSPDLVDKPVSYILWPVHRDGSFGVRAVHPLDPSVVVAPPGSADDAPGESTPRPVTDETSVDASTGITVSIDRSVIEPRDDYRVFVVVFLDRMGREVTRVEVMRPDVLDLSVGEVTFPGLDPCDASFFGVIPKRRSGEIGRIRVQPLEPR